MHSRSVVKTVIMMYTYDNDMVNFNKSFYIILIGMMYIYADNQAFVNGLQLNDNCLSL